MQKIKKFTLPLILLAAFIIRLISINQSLWLDEATSALVARMSLTNIFTKFLPNDFHPPLYYLVLKYWVSIFGSSEVALRFPSIIFGVGTIYIVYLITKKYFSKNTGLVAAALLSTSGLAIYYSQEARMYTLAAFLVTLSFYYFIENRWKSFATTVVLIGLTDYVSLFILPVYLLINPKVWKKTLTSFIPLGIGFLLWLPIFIRQISAGSSVVGSAWWNILGTVTFKNIELIPVKFILGRISFDNKTLYGAVVLFTFIVFGYALILVRQKARAFWYWLVIPILIGVLISFKVPSLTYFRFLFCLPAFYILVAYGVERMGKYKYVLLGAILTVNLLSSFYYLLNPKFQREDWRSAAATIGSDAVVFPKNSHEEALIYYGKASQIIDVSSIEPSNRVIWLSRYVWEITDPEDLTRAKIEKLGYTKAGEYNFNGVVFYRYTKNSYAYLY